MNIFVLHQSAPLAAKMHCDKHVVKMTLETAQILATVHHIHGNGANVTYKPTHENHPCVVWAAASLANYRWLLTLGQYLAREYKLRYGKYHACTELFSGELSDAPPALNKAPSVPFALCMPDECKTDDPVESYRNYYRHKLDTTDWMSWDRAGGAPLWLNSPEFA
ncbi:MAG: pyrimidine dimer DNA glycosylase/endonuclease V [Actinomycetes bacterium]|jgi:hypothetical protein